MACKEFNWNTFSFLSDSEVMALYERLSSGDVKAREELVIGNLGLVNFILNKCEVVCHEKDDLFECGVIGLIKAIDSYDIDKDVKFMSYAGKCISNEIFMYCRYNNRHLNVDKLERVLSVDKYGNKLLLSDILVDENVNLFEGLERECEYNEISFALSELHASWRYINLLYYGFVDGKCYNQEEISEIVGVSQSYVSRILRYSVIEMRRILTNLDKGYDKINYKRRIKKIGCYNW